MREIGGKRLIQEIKQAIMRVKKEEAKMESLNALIKSWVSQGLVDKVFTALITLVVGILVIKAVMRLLTRALEKSKLEKAAYSLILSLARVGLYLLLGLSLATSLGIDVTGVVALASVLTLAVSLALQNMLTNVLGGFTLLTTHPFHSGDYVDIGGQSGTVTQIDMSYTRLVTVDNKVVCIPNSTVLASEVVNYSANDTRRAEIQVSAGYDAPTQKVIDALVLAATVDNALLEPAPFAAVVSYVDYAINYTLLFCANTEDYWDVYFKVNQRIKDIFDEQGIPMTYPHLNVHFDKEFLESRKNG